MQAVEAVGVRRSRRWARGPFTDRSSAWKTRGWSKSSPARTDDRRRVFALQPAGRRALALEADRLARLTALVRSKRLHYGGGLTCARSLVAPRLPAGCSASIPREFRSRFAADLRSRLRADAADARRPRRLGPGYRRSRAGPFR